MLRPIHLSLIAVIAAAGLLCWPMSSSLFFNVFAQDTQPQAERAAATQLPMPDPTFKGKIGATYKDSTPSYPLPVTTAKGSPNVLLILLDDVGYGMCSTYGGPVPTPHMDQLANNGLRYTRFHTTALCSPTRGALLAGRNHHSISTGVIIEMGTGYPGYTGIIPKSTALVSQTLRDNGYATGMFGKWHNTPEPDISPAGPFDRWPTGLGFDYFYGFNQGETHQYYPTIYRNTTWVPQPKSPEQGYHFTADMTDEAIAWTRNVRAASPDKPWFNYFSTSGVHAPHHAPIEWRAKFAGKFDHGWDRQRELTHARQLEIGIIPKGTKLTPRSKDVPAWADQTPEARKVYARLMENYAAYMAYTDHEVGRLIESLRASGELDNTLVMYVVGDNGASAEGGLEGTFSEVASLLGVQLGLESSIKRIDEIGGPSSEPHVPVGWAWAMNAPFQWTKQVASHFGGTRNPLIVHWPEGIKSKGETRNQFHHVIDVVPTILEACKISEPKVVNGIVQKPIEGVSMVYSFDDAQAKDRRTTQYFELATNRAIYHDGWVACSPYGLPWETAGRGDGFLTAPWELYNINEDFSEANDLAMKMPEKLQELKTKFLEEAQKYDVLPLDPRFSERFDPSLRVGGEPRTGWTYFGNNVWLPEPIGPQLFTRAHTTSAELNIPKGGAEGVVTCAGAFSAGWSLYVKGGKPVFRYTFFEVADVTINGTESLPEGKVTLKTEFTPDGSKEGGGTLKLFVDGKPAGEGKLKRSAFRHGLEPFEVGRDSITPVSPDYKTPFEFTGTIEKITFTLTK
ncbi:Arylsulfatase [Planctopirus ephydatiae]|uniref:Arylsulfatase n=1 Tax=Planctopirus ephydatiae TaxID=2528019 RepID=A0A518GRT1_9PLAN|nr:sulfatase-like hydrolase/transferase [Planctopirus ephydatiae]QDV31300.1 Arylsulfatase [Planctopirus ephydatiae]